MLINILNLVGFLCLLTSLVMFCSQFLSADFMNKKRREKYFRVSEKLKESRSSIEQKFINNTWHQYYATKIKIISFRIGIIAISISIVIDYIIN